VKIAVTGGKGFVGSYLVKQLQQLGHEVTILDIVHRPYVDITNLYQTIEALKHVDIVYHLAGTVLGMARKNPHLSAELDLLGTANVLEACVANNVRKIIFASSFYVYDGISKDKVVDEEVTLDLFKQEWFGSAKLIAERMIRNYSDKLKYTILRFGPVYGPHERCSCVVYYFAKEALQGNPIVIWGKGERLNQYTFVEDIVRGCVNVLDSKHAENETINLISPEQVSINHVAKEIAQCNFFENNMQVQIIHDLSKHEGSSMPYMSSEKAISLLNWYTIDLRKGIHKTMEKLKKKFINDTKHNLR